MDVYLPIAGRQITSLKNVTFLNNRMINYCFKMIMSIQTIASIILRLYDVNHMIIKYVFNNFNYIYVQSNYTLNYGDIERS